MVRTNETRNNVGLLLPNTARGCRKRFFSGERLEMSGGRGLSQENTNDKACSPCSRFQPSLQGDGSSHTPLHWFTIRRPHKSDLPAIDTRWPDVSLPPSACVDETPGLRPMDLLFLVQDKSSIGTINPKSNSIPRPDAKDIDPQHQGR